MLFNSKPIALIWKDNGPVGCSNCSEPFYDILSSDYDCYYVGPHHLNLTAELLATAALYVQPGGADNLEKAW